MEYFIAVGILSLVLYIWYARIVTRNNQVQEALSGIDVQLQKRSDLLPNILTIAKRYMEHEKDLLEEVTALRSKVSEPYDRKNLTEVQEHLSAAGALTSRMGQLNVQMEAYPELRADDLLQDAMHTYSEVEANISAARRFYNSANASLRNAVQIFPGNLLASLAHVSQLPEFYEADDLARQPVNASDYL